MTTYSAHKHRGRDIKCDWMHLISQRNRKHLFPFFKTFGFILLSFDCLWAISMRLLLFFFSYSCPALHENKMPLSLETGGKNQRENVQENENERGRQCCSWNHLGVPSIILSLWHTGCVFLFFLALLHAVNVLCTHALFITAFINNLIEKQGEESHQNIIGPNGTDRIP